MTMVKKSMISTALMGSLVLAPFTGCSSLPGNDKQQGAVIGGVGGALAGAALAKNNRGIGALIGAALGAGGGWLIGANKDKITGKNKDSEQVREEAIRASERGKSSPAGPEDVEKSRTADLNDDGFVTLDEVVAMRQANLSDDEMVTRLERTEQVFELTNYQENHLRDRGVSDDVIRQMRNMNQDLTRTASSDSEADRLDSGRDRDSDNRYDTRDRDSDLDRDADRRDRF